MMSLAFTRFSAAPMRPSGIERTVEVLGSNLALQAAKTRFRGKASAVVPASFPTSAPKETG